MGQPLLFWIFFGSGFSGSFRPQGGALSYPQFFYPGILLMVILFTALFANFSLIEDRKEGFLQGAWVSPVARWTLVFGKVLGAATLALFQAALFLGLAPFVSISLSTGVILKVCLALACVAIALSALGFALAWKMDSIQGFHAIMMLLFLPMWFLSGAFFPIENVPAWMRMLIQVNPLTYALSWIKHSLWGEAAVSWASALPMAPSVGWSLFFMSMAFFIAVRRAKKY